MEPERIRRGVRGAIRDNATAYSYSVLITVTFVATQQILGTPTVGHLFLYVLGATGSFVVLEAISSRFFQVEIKPEPSNVVLVGSAFSPLTVAASLGAAVGLAYLTHGWVGWLTTPLVATTTFILLAGVELAVARMREEEAPMSETSEDAED